MEPIHEEGWKGKGEDGHGRCTTDRFSTMTVQI